MVSTRRPRVVLATNAYVREHYLAPQDLDRLNAFADWSLVELGGDLSVSASNDPEAVELLKTAIGAADALIVAHGAPRISGSILDQAPKLRFVGDLEGDRFAHRLDLDELWKREIRVVDTTNASSYPVAEWALALILVSLRNGGYLFRKMLEPVTWAYPFLEHGWPPGELTGKVVGLVGCGHIGRRLIRFLHAFDCQVRVFDPYIAKELPDALNFLQTSLAEVMSGSDAVVCLAPLTPATHGLIGRPELELLRPGSVFVNVARGAVVDTAALIERLERGDVVAGLDVFDPEPLPGDSPLKKLPNVFLSPHLGGTTAESRPRFFALMVDELERFFNGHETRFDLTARSRAERTGTETPGA